MNIEKFRENLISAVTEERDEVANLMRSEEFEKYGDPSYHTGWYESRLVTLNNIIEMIRES